MTIEFIMKPVIQNHAVTTVINVLIVVLSEAKQEVDYKHVCWQAALTF